MKIAQDSKVCDLLMTYSRLNDPWKVTWEAHAGSWRVKCQAVFCESLRDLANPWVTCETLFLDDYKYDSYTLHPYYIYPYYPQKCIEAIQKKILERFLQYTHLVRESYSSSKRKILIVSSPPLSHWYTLRWDLYSNTNHTHLECRLLRVFWNLGSFGSLPK